MLRGAVAGAGGVALDTVWSVGVARLQNRSLLARRLDASVFGLALPGPRMRVHFRAQPQQDEVSAVEHALCR